MPSHFHSACQSPIGPRLSGTASSGWARKNGYKRLTSASLASGASRRSKKVAEGSQSPINRCATTAASMPAASARARVTSCCETPTRNAPVISLFQTNRWRSSISAQARRIASCWTSRSAPRSGSSRSSTQRLKGQVARDRGRREAARRSSRPGRRPRGTTPRTASRGCPPPPRPRCAASPWAPPASASGRSGSRPPRPHPREGPGAK